MDWFRPRTPPRPRVREGFDAQIEFLLSEPHDIAFLVIAVKGSDEDFIQFAANEESVLFDFPLATKRQQEHEARVRAACAALGLVANITTGPDDTRYLNCTLPRDAHVLTNAARVLVEQTFGVRDESKLEFQTHDA